MLVFTFSFAFDCFSLFIFDVMYGCFIHIIIFHNNITSDLIIMSYLDAKRFIDDQVRLLNGLLVLSPELREICRSSGVSESEIRSFLFQFNLHIKRHNRTRYSRPMVHETIQRLLEIEQRETRDLNFAKSNVQVVLESTNDDSFVPKLPLSIKVERAINLADLMPLGVYLFTNLRVSNANNVGATGSILKSEAGKLPTKNQEQSVHEIDTKEDFVKKETDLCKADNPENSYASLKDKSPAVSLGTEAVKPDYRNTVLTSNENKLREQYELSRAVIMDQRDEIIYKVRKLEYLRTLNSLAAFQPKSSSNEASGRELDLKSEMRRFCILTEKVYYQMNERYDEIMR